MSTLIFTESETSSALYAKDFYGSDWGARVNAADAELGSLPGEIWLDRAAGTSAPAANVVLSRNHILRIIQAGVTTWGLEGTYSLGSSRILLNTGSGIVSDYGLQTEFNKSVCNFFYTGSGTAIRPQTTSAVTYGVKLKGFMITGPNGTASTIGIDLYNCNSWVIEDVSVFLFNGTGSVGIRLYGDMEGCYYSVLNRVYVENVTTGLLFDSDNLTNAPNANMVWVSRIDVAEKAINVNYGATLMFRDVIINGITGTAIRCNSNLNTFENVRIENPTPETAGTIGLDFTNVDQYRGENNEFSGTIVGFDKIISIRGIGNNLAKIRTNLGIMIYGSEGTPIANQTVDASDSNAANWNDAGSGTV